MTLLSEFAHRARWRAANAAWRLRCRVQRQPLYRFRLPNGLRFDYPLRSEIGRAMFLINRFEVDELRFVARFLRPGMTFLDVGANGGLFSLVAARAVGASGLVHAFEPAKMEFELLQHNLALNGLKNVMANQVALSDQIGEAQFAICRGGAYNSLGRNNLTDQKIVEWQAVRTTTLDAYIAAQKLGSIHLLKIDTEGAELMVLRGSAQLLRAPDAPVVLCEFSDLTTAGLGYSTADLWAFFTDLGFQLFQYLRHKLTLANRKDWHEYDNLIAVRDPAILASV
ncbi:MAG: FkbM family methyltransferase [Anaerolineales bacterium]